MNFRFISFIHANTEPMLIILKDIENRVDGHCHLITFPNKRLERNFSRPIAYDLVSIRQCVETIQEEPIVERSELQQGETPVKR